MNDNLPQNLAKLALRVEQAAHAVSLSRSLLYESIADGRLVARKAGGCTIIEVEELKRYLRSLPAVVPKGQAA